MIYKIISSIAILAILSSCASIVSKSSYPVSIQSSPSGAKFRIKDEIGNVVHSGLTPATVTLDASDGYFSKAKYTVEYKKDGLDTQTATIYPTIDGWYIANILFGGFIGLLIVDPLTGAMYKLPKLINSSLSDDNFSNNENKDLKIVSIESLTDEQKTRLIAIN